MSTYVYLDYASTTPVDEEVLKQILPYFNEKFANPSSRHEMGGSASSAVKNATVKVARLINCLPEEIIFTSGATEAINLALKGVAEFKGHKGHIITVKTEHKATLDVCAQLEKLGIRVTYLDVDNYGIVDPMVLKETIASDTFLISVMYANNETGVLQNIKEIGELAKEKNILFMSDATQAVGKIDIDVQKDRLDLMAFSAHKFYGPKGIGVLYIRSRNPNVKLSAQMHGGGHQRNIRSGTLNVPGIMGLGAASEVSTKLMQKERIRICTLRDKLEQDLQVIDGVYVNGSKKHRLPNILNIGFRGVDNEALMVGLRDIAISTGSACSTNSVEPSHVLTAMGLKEEEVFNSIRISLGRYTTLDDIDYAGKRILEEVVKLRAMST